MLSFAWFTVCLDARIFTLDGLSICGEQFGFVVVDLGDSVRRLVFIHKACARFVLVVVFCAGFDTYIGGARRRFRFLVGVWSHDLLQHCYRSVLGFCLLNGWWATI